MNLKSCKTSRQIIDHFIDHFIKNLPTLRLQKKKNLGQFMQYVHTSHTVILEYFNIKE